jgi:hypothetical protein
MFPDNRPAQTLQQKQASLAQAAAPSSNIPAPASLNEKEIAILHEATEKIAKAPAQAFEIVLDIWRADHSADLKKGILLQGIQSTHASQEADLMRFMISALENPKAEREKVAQLARGNGLEKGLAAKRLLVLNQNPQTRIAD